MVGTPNAKSNDESCPVRDTGADSSLVPAAGNAQICKACGVEMTLLGKIPHNWQHPQIVVYRCFGCDDVITAEA
jgi:hypothetical protein